MYKRQKVNLIPFNPFPNTPYQRSDDATITQFRETLMHAGINTITRKTRGERIDAACGQLVGQVEDKTRRKERYAKKQEANNLASSFSLQSEIEKEDC